MTDIAERVAELQDECIALRRDFHQHPELGQAEFRTSRVVCDYLRQCGLEPAICTATGVIAVLEGEQPGPTLLLRADMDALPVQEETGLPYASQMPGVMHACGHDAHTAILLVVAKVLSGMRHKITGRIKFLFQPNEENVGALAMIEEGALEEPQVDACMALHVWNPLPSGKVGLTAGPVMGGIEHFRLVIKGQGGHTATPHNAVDPILAAAAVVQGVQAIQTREVDSLREPMVIMFGQIEGGSASNVIPDEVVLHGTMRYLFEGEAHGPNSPKGRFERVIAGICAAHRAGYELEFEHGHPTLVNTPAMVDLVRDVVQGDMPHRLEPASLVTLAGEDFSEFASRVPGVFCFLGAGYEGGRCHPHHHCQFDFDESVLSAGVELMVRGALRYFDAGS